MSIVNKIPQHFTPCLSKYSSALDKESLLDDDKELWLIRIPDNFSLEDLKGLKIRLPLEKDRKLAKLEKANCDYVLNKVPTEQFNALEEEEEEKDTGVSGQEMFGFDCLFPCREENGKLVKLNKTIEHYLTLEEKVEIPDSTQLAESIRDAPVYKREQPEGLKMRFMPTGYYSGQKRTHERTEESQVKKKAKKEKKSKKEKK
ncbi:DNA-directed RNA polymerase I, subunit RPA34.5 [Sporodiniella umbellata]|nr:DNA-directed RNA polymerase I, subunit RPA34.5 [Sporodiniella umbellata]